MTVMEKVLEHTTQASKLDSGFALTRAPDDGLSRPLELAAQQLEL
jgi:hypothetical protein